MAVEQTSRQELVSQDPKKVRLTLGHTPDGQPLYYSLDRSRKPNPKVVVFSADQERAIEFFTKVFKSAQPSEIYKLIFVSDPNANKMKYDFNQDDKYAIQEYVLPPANIKEGLEGLLKEIKGNGNNHDKPGGLLCVVGVDDTATIELVCNIAKNGEPLGIYTLFSFDERKSDLVSMVANLRGTARVFLGNGEQNSELEIPEQNIRFSL